MVVIGTVKNIKDTPAPLNEMFHSMALIQIDTVLKGKTNLETIIIRLESGPITGDIKVARILVSDEPRFKIGERYVLFLNKSSNDSYLNSGWVKEKYKSFNNKKSVSELSDDTFWAGNRQVFEVKNGIIHYFEKTITQDDFINNIIKGNQ